MCYYLQVTMIDDLIVTDLSFPKVSEKLDEKLLYTKISAPLCNPLIYLLIILLWFI